MSAPASRIDRQDLIPGFRIQREIARGGMAEVYLAQQLSLGRSVALKVLSAFDDAEQRTRFQRESRIIGGLNHRNIITIFDVGEAEGRVYLAMEYLGGGDLADRIGRGPIDLCEALEIAACVGDCLAFVHENGIVHRDVKPANVLFHEDGTPILTDFGIASDSNLESGLTVHGATVGSPSYMSPEQAAGGVTDGRTDIYSLGIVLYEMLAGRPPFQEGSAVETMAARLNTPVPRLPTELRSCQGLLDRMLARAGDDRFQSAGEMVEAIRSLQLELAAEPVGSIPDPGRLWLRVQSVFADLDVAARRFVASRSGVLESSRAKKVVLALLVLAVLAAGVDWLTVPADVRHNLARAEAAVDEDRLARPWSGSAVFHYRQVLMLDPENDDALDGLHEVAERFADRAEADLEARAFSSAKVHVDRGLNAEPGNERLLALQDDTKELRSLPEKLVRGVRSLFD